MKATKESQLEARTDERPSMLVADFDQFVIDSDQSIEKPESQRVGIAIYGLAAEIGSVVAAVKKRLLGEGGSEDWNAPNDEIVEELGDVMWYCFSLAKHANPDKPVNIFAHDIAKLRREIGAEDERARRIQRALDGSKRDAFLAAAEHFPKKAKVLSFEAYQDLAILTARTQDRTLVEVCLAVLWQLSAELFRNNLPDVELELNQAVADRPINDVLAEIAWHISALASIYGLTLSQVARHNMEKVAYRQNRDHPTPLHDRNYKPAEQLPRQMEVSFVTVGKGRSRMYYQGRQLGDELTDNAYDDDGYRFHDIMHLANLAKLGWSPVVRGLLGRKRKSDPMADQVEDGARAKIVEEAVIKAIHSEGDRLARLRGPQPANKPLRLFLGPRDITFRFLKFIHNFVSGLEVEANRYWEWEEAIIEGHEIFYRLRCEGQGTVTIDLEKRTIAFHPDVYVDLPGRVAGLGSATADVGDEDEQLAREKAQKLAVLDALGLPASDTTLGEFTLKELGTGRVCTKAAGTVREAMWKKEVVAFRTTLVPVGARELHATAIALADA